MYDIALFGRVLKTAVVHISLVSANGTADKTLLLE